MAEAADLKSAQSGFESQWGHLVGGCFAFHGHHLDTLFIERLRDRIEVYGSRPQIVMR